MPVLRAPSSSAKKELPKKPVKSDKRRYLCNSCGYRFSRMAHIEFNNICPYCGKASVVDDMTSDAQKLIEASKTYDDDRFFGSR